MKQYKNFLIDDDLNIYNSITGNKLTPYVGTDGDMQVHCRDENKKIIHERVHTIIATCFIPNPNNYKYVNHIDSDKTNNSIENLEWCTNSYNVYHGWHSGNRTHKNRTKLKVTDLNDNFIGIYDSIRKCGKELHIDRHQIARVLKGELRKDYLGYYFYYVDNR